MDDIRTGAAIRAIRLRRRWRQVDLARRSGVSTTMVARIERGAIGTVPVGRVRQVAAGLGARLDLLVRWQGGDLGRLLDERHAGMEEELSRVFARLEGWEAEPEVSFAIYGERGAIDLLAWHGDHRALLVVELKTEIVDVGDLMRTMDRRRRLALAIATARRWTASSVSTWVIAADSRTNRRAVARHATVLRAKMPIDGRGIRGWLRDPTGRVDALSFLSYSHGVTASHPMAPIRRVRPTRHP
ncbi:MAG: helix-turn-helix domain-containing protein [Candidatus Limnocylindrales bacterium]